MDNIQNIEELYNRLEELTEETKKAYESRRRKKQSDIINRATNVIYPERLEDFKEQVLNSNDSDLKIINIALQVIEAIEFGASFETAYKMLLNHNPSEMIENVIRSIVCEYSKQGPNFFEETAKKEISESDKEYLEDLREENRYFEAKQSVRNQEDREELKNIIVEGLDEISLDTIEEDLDLGEFNSRSEMTDLIEDTLDKIPMEEKLVTREEIIGGIEEAYNEDLDDELSFVPKDKTLINFERKANMYVRAGELVYPQKYEEITKYIDADIEEETHVMDTVLNIMDAINQGLEKQEVIEIFNSQPYVDILRDDIRRIVCIFSKKGPDFYEYTTNEELTAEEIAYLDLIRRQNLSFEKENKTEKTM